MIPEIHKELLVINKKRQTNENLGSRHINVNIESQQKYKKTLILLGIRIDKTIRENPCLSDWKKNQHVKN